MTTPLPEIASLWIGERLSFLELLCLKSFVDAGHKVTLYTYGALKNPPYFCEIRDAREIWDNDQIIVHHKNKSPAIHSDIWRIKLMLKSDAIWVDTDAYCVKPFEPVDGYLVGIEDSRGVNNAVLRLPKDSVALREFDTFLSTSELMPPWWTAEEELTFMKSGLAIEPGNFRWGTTGPEGLSYFMKRSGEINRALPRHTLYPLPFGKKGIMLRPPSIAGAHVLDDTISVHLYASNLRRRIAKDGIPASSYLHHLCKKHNITLPSDEKPEQSVSEAPGRPRVARRRWKRQNRRLAQRLIFDILAKSRSERGGRLSYVQVGANDGSLDDPLYEYTKDMDFDALLIEPSPVYYSALCTRHANSPNVMTLNVGVSSQEGTLKLYQLNPEFESSFPWWAPGCASMSREILVASLSKARDVQDEMVQSTEVPVERLDTILTENDALDTDILVIDVEGYELNVFDSFSLLEFSPKVIMFEFVHLTDFDVSQIHTHLSSAGYRMFVLESDVIAMRADWLPQSLIDTIGYLSVPEW
jgi:FkbM family methyltransferase